MNRVSNNRLCLIILSGLRNLIRDSISFLGPKFCRHAPLFLQDACFAAFNWTAIVSSMIHSRKRVNMICKIQIIILYELHQVMSFL